MKGVEVNVLNGSWIYAAVCPLLSGEDYRLLWQRYGKRGGAAWVERVA